MNPFAIGTTLKADTKKDTLVANALQQVRLERDALKQMGVRPELIDWIVIQDWMESGAFTNTGFVKHNNPGNIMWNKHDKYGTKGTYNAKNKTYYSHYPNIQAYLKKKMAVLSQAPARPIDATSGQDFVNRLGTNHYYVLPDTPASYTKAMKGAAQRMNIVADLQTDTDQVVTDELPKEGIKPIYIVGAIMVLAAIVTIKN